MNPRRRTALRAAIALSIASVTGGALAATPTIEVWKSPSCGCCAEWVKHLQANGFTVNVNDGDNAAARTRLGVPAKLGACHTAQVAGYAIEGHVPAADIKRLLAEKPNAVGLVVPGMPIGSPGMEQDAVRDPYDVLMIERGGSTRVYRSYR